MTRVHVPRKVITITLSVILFGHVFTVRARPGRLRGLRVSCSESFLYGAFCMGTPALNRQKTAVSGPGRCRRSRGSRSRSAGWYVPFLPRSPSDGLILSHSPYNLHVILTSHGILRLREGPRAGDEHPEPDADGQHGAPGESENAEAKCAVLA